MNKPGVYLHVPFCRSRCSYCDFATDVYKSAVIVESYVDALVKEISNFKFQILNSEIEKSVDTVYLGGGTPSLLSAGQVERILEAVYSKFSVTADAEVTIEMNPATATLETLKDYKTLGINRASFGAQTFDDAELKRLGRKHTADDVRDTIDLLRKAGYENVGFDLIAGLPRQTVADWKRNLKEALDLQPEHLSLYLLEISEGTPLAEQIRKGRQALPDEDLAAEMYEILIETVARKGFVQYEISNFALAGYESKHNSKYWTLDAVYSFGCSAHSFDGVNVRYSNERDTARYVALIEQEKSPVVHRETIEAAAEFVYLGLRLTRGIDLKNYEARFGVNLTNKYAADLARLKDAELVEYDENVLKLTTKGTLFSNEVFEVFI